MPPMSRAAFICHSSRSSTRRSATIAMIMVHVLGSGRERLQEVGRAVQAHPELLGAPGGPAPGGLVLNRWVDPEAPTYTSSAGRVARSFAVSLISGRKRVISATTKSQNARTRGVRFRSAWMTR
jgi:hypothetical protein